MASHSLAQSESFTMEQGAAFPWILEHLLTYPGTYEIPLRTMYTLNANTQNPAYHQQQPTNVFGNAFPRKSGRSEEQFNANTQTAATQLKAGGGGATAIAADPCAR